MKKTKEIFLGGWIKMTFKIKPKKLKEKDISRELGGLWKVQYKPREKALFEIMDKKEKARWGKLSRFQKMRIIDNMQEKGAFK